MAAKERTTSGLVREEAKPVSSLLVKESPPLCPKSRENSLLLNAGSSFLFHRQEFGIIIGLKIEPEGFRNVKCQFQPPCQGFGNILLPSNDITQKRRRHAEPLG